MVYQAMITPTELFGVEPFVNAGTLSADLSATALDVATMPSGAAFLSFFVKQAQAGQGIEPDRIVEVAETTPLVTTRGGVLKTRYRYTVDFYGDPMALDPNDL